ncbi:MAG: sarcosine oxidase subunit gamma [Fulvimarina manganoxydans]|uniref:sarcosine oxidase subunit gamma n=1 Tax=Fulvimarina manganoxydans TaxID=937218 RepID=UPI0023522BC0|nr:sarcosine oxidase subunit gamma family protein [Fulvimarina manganoxydans]MCK5931348.1 sarcosine oxidase subunit gamma [Fulvimarina manganoxydans]
MLEVNLARRTPAIRPAAVASAGPIRIAPETGEGRLSFRAKAKALGGREDVAGFAVDGAINSRKSDGDTASLRLGPDEWLFICPEGDIDDAMSAIERAMDGAAHSLVDVSHRDVTFTVSGQNADAVINAGCPLDLSLDRFPVGKASRTVFGKSDIVLARVGHHDFRVTTWRSFAPYVHGLLLDAAKDYAG